MVRGVRPSILVAAALLSACATLPTQTSMMKEQGVEVTSEAIRVRLRAEAVPFTGRMEQAIDEATARSPDPAVRRAGLVLKIDVVPALYRTIFHQRPLVALLDTWALLVQVEGYLESPEGKAALGPGGAGVLATTRDLERRIREIAAWAVPGRDMGPIEAKVRDWAAQHPVRAGFASRDGVESYLVTVAPGEALSAFAAVGVMTEDLQGLIGRMDFLPVMVPRQATWQAELAYVDLMDPRLEVALTRGGQALQRIDDMLAWLGTTGLEGFAEEQRIQLMRALTTQRVEVEKLVDRQRAELQAFVEKERGQVAAMVAQERVAAMADAQRLADHATAEAARQAREVVDHAVSRVALLLVAAVVGGLLIAWVARRRPARPVPPA
jgi:hypothetical protein